MSDNKEQVEGERWQMWPLYAAGFTTAFGAHAVAANLVFDLDDLASSLLYLGLLLALYDGAEVLLKPVFGTLADRIGAKPVLLGGLVAFAAASLLFVLVADTDWLWLARLGQGAAASAFSPAASSSVARLTRKGKHGSAFGTYGFYKSLGYTLGPLLGGVIVWAGGLTLLFAVMTVLALVVAIWAQVSVPTLPPLPRARQTVVDLARRLSDRQFLGPTAALAASTAALSVGVGFLPVAGVDAGLGPIATGAAVSVLALCAAFAQPRTGRALDAGKITVQRGVACGLVVTAAGLALAMIPGLVGILTAAVAVGIGTGIITPLGFAALAASTPEERMGQTMGAAELGRELGDAGGPLIVAGVAAVATLTAGFGVLAVITLLIGADSARQRAVRSTQ
ncbi:MFS transporter [Rhodococcus sp. NPDC056743]|uniref:MFS transporter n=1 Tax=Rhodococcus sp. NPDC056743 TaxID=3345934 RepID=UPI0036720CEF